MNRVIKFRAVRKSDKKFVYGDLVYDLNRNTLIANFDNNVDGVVLCLCVNGSEQQFTGVRDSSGCEVYEGDLVTYSLNGDSTKRKLEGYIEFFRHAWRINGVWLLTEATIVEVVSNYIKSNKMIQSKDLRLGNFVKDRNGKTIRIDFISHVQDGYDVEIGMYFLASDGVIDTLSEYTDFAIPIPITTEWLERFGFEKYSNGSYRLRLVSDSEAFLSVALSDKSNPDIAILHSDLYLMPISFLSNFNLKHVHQLQNLHYSLTGKELECVGDVTEQNETKI